VLVLESSASQPRSDRRPDPDVGVELRKAEMAIRQLERAELYIVSAINLELANPALRRALHQLRGELLAVHELLRKPHLAR
jgi:hypothetical protein